MKNEIVATPANLITFGGMILAVLAFITLWQENYLLAIICWSLGWLTDWLDGQAARYLEKRHPNKGIGRTRLGAMLDPIRDKLLIMAVVIPAIHIVSHLGFALFMALYLVLEGPANLYLQEKLRGQEGTYVIKASKVITALQIVPFVAILCALYIGRNFWSADVCENILVAAAGLLMILSLQRINYYQEEVSRVSE